MFLELAKSAAGNHRYDISARRTSIINHGTLRNQSAHRATTCCCIFAPYTLNILNPQEMLAASSHQRRGDHQRLCLGAAGINILAVAEYLQASHSTGIDRGAAC